MNEIEELLTFPIICSFEVIADYPGNNIEVDTIINLRCGNDLRFHTGAYIEPYAYTDNGAITEHWLLMYPHLFKKIK
jgi:hypothetical protein